MPTPEIIVGIDGSPESEQALLWAAREAVRRYAELLVVNVYDWNDMGPATAMGAPAVADAREHAEELVADALATLRDMIPNVAVRGQAVLGQVAPTLDRASAEGATIVVGNRGRGGFASLLLGSVSQHVALHARGPVVVVRGRPDPQVGPVVVGVDGSPESERALRVAFEEAAIRSTGVVAVRAYRRLTPTYAAGMPSLVEDPDERREAELTALAAEVAPWAEKYPYIDISCIVAEGAARDVLTRRSATACMVVVGNRGHGGFSGLLLGSVGQHLLHHADCPVLVARAAGADRGASRLVDQAP
jgi:nucleotide-binding universal stress UspA family protein